MFELMKITRLKGIKKSGPRVYLADTAEATLMIIFDLGRLTVLATTDKGTDADPRTGLVIADLHVPDEMLAREITDAKLMRILEGAGFAFENKVNQQPIIVVSR